MRARSHHRRRPRRHVVSAPAGEAHGRVDLERHDSVRRGYLADLRGGGGHDGGVICAGRGGVGRCGVGAVV